MNAPSVSLAAVSGPEVERAIEQPMDDHLRCGQVAITGLAGEIAGVP